jgi:hypothetical protein
MGSVVHIKIDNLSGPEIHELLQEHLASMRLHSPPESIHALPIEGLREPEITFWTVWENGELLGCGALKELDSQHAEIKIDADIFATPEKRRSGDFAALHHRRSRAPRLSPLKFGNWIDASFRTCSSALRSRRV